MSDQPRFPTYHGPPLPQVLNPLNPRHYGLLFKWVFFQPSKLLHYSRQADEELYEATGWMFLKKIFRVAAIRNLCIQGIILTLLLSASLTLFSSMIQGSPLDWSGVAFRMGVILALNMAGVVAIVVAGVVAFGVTRGVAFGVVGGMLGGVAYGVAFGVVGVVMVGVAVSLAGGVAVSLAGGVAVSLAGGVAGGLAGGIGGSRFIFHFLEWPLSWLQSRTTVNAGETHKQLPQHPAIWDELAAWPLQGTTRLLQDTLSTNLSFGMRQLLTVAANPFQRGAAQRALSDWLAQQATPLSVLYNLCHLRALNEYLFPPSSKQQFERWPSARVVLLSELGQQFIAATSNGGETSEKAVWRLTKRQRRMTPTPLSRFSHLLRDLFRDQNDLETAPPEDFETLLAPNRFQAVADCPHGVEITASFAAMRHFLGCQTINDLNAAQSQLHSLNNLVQPLIRPPVIQALRALGDVGQQTARFSQTTNLRQKSTALNLAAGRLNELESYIRQHVLPPERVLLIRIVQLWQDIVAATQGEFAQSTLQHMSRAEQRQTTGLRPLATIWQRPATPIDNPYIVGNPVSPPLFVGRNDIFNRISDVWTAKDNPDSVILYGHRRMGKSSILRNLDQAAPSGSLIVYADLGGETSFVESSADLLLALASKIYHSARRTFPDAAFSEPDPTRYDSAAKASFQFKQLAEQVRDTLGDKTLILALDEFEAIEKAVVDGKISSDIFQFLRTTSQQKWLTFIFGGLHTLDEMSRDYQQPFYNSYVNILVSYLSHEAAENLITDPDPNFKLNYEPAAVAQIITVSGGQPSLLQQLCRDALNHLNHELFD
ncbi:MAG: ATP-binding protein, partial [Chloroflexi bacterium]|nr:ATP-binding protein [Chloroflexota bacterium]